MRISGGLLRGRQFEAPKGHKTHPMSERARSALFNVLGDITGLSVLDAYAGSGALGFEAASRGARLVQLVEQDSQAFKIIKVNIEVLELPESQIHATQANVASWAASQTQPFDIVICDPPYDELSVSQIKSLGPLVSPHGLLVVSHPGDSPEISGFSVVDNKSYGDANLTFYRK